MQNIEDRLIDLEMCVANQERVLEELNAEVVRLSKLTETLTLQNKWLIEQLNENPIKPLSEETRPPHY